MANWPSEFESVKGVGSKADAIKIAEALDPSGRVTEFVRDHIEKCGGKLRFGPGLATWLPTPGGGKVMTKMSMSVSCRVCNEAIKGEWEGSR